MPPELVTTSQRRDLLSSSMAISWRTTMKKCTLALAIALAGIAAVPATHASELKPITSLPIGGYGSAFNAATGILYTTDRSYIHAYDVANHELLSDIDTGDSGIGTVSVNPIANKIYTSNMSGSVVIDGDTHEVSVFVPWAPNSGLTVLADRRHNTMYALYTTYEFPFGDSTTHLKSFEADTLIPVASISFEDEGGAAFAVNEETHQVYLQRHGGQRIRVLDGTSLAQVAIIDDVFPRGPGSIEILPFNPVANRLYVFHRNADGVTIADTEALEVVGFADVPNCRDLVVDKRRHRAFVTTMDGPELYFINAYDELNGSITLSRTGQVTGIPAVNSRTGSVYVPAWDDGYAGIAVIRRQRLIQRVDLDTLINAIHIPRLSRRVYAAGQPIASWELLVRWPGHPSISSNDSKAGVPDIAQD